MAKKRKIKARKSKQVRKVRIPKLKGALKTGDILISMGILFTLVIVASILFGTERIMEYLAIQGLSGVITAKANWIAMSVALLFLAYVIYTVNRIFKLTLNYRQAIGLVVLGVLMGLGVYFGPPILLVPSALIVIGAALYLSKTW